MDRAPSTALERRIDAHATALIIESIFTVLFVAFSLSLSIAGPIYAYVFKGIYATPTGVIIPGVDPETPRGFAVNVAVQFTCTFVGCIGMICVEMVACVINNTYTVMADVVCYHLRKLSDNLLPGTFSYQNKAEIRNVFMQLQDVESYLKKFYNIYYWKLFTQPILTTGCVSLGIFSQMMVSIRWISGRTCKCWRKRLRSDLMRIFRMISGLAMDSLCACTFNC